MPGIWYGPDPAYGAFLENRNVCLLFNHGFGLTELRFRAPYEYSALLGLLPTQVANQWQAVFRHVRLRLLPKQKPPFGIVVNRKILSCQ